MAESNLRKLNHVNSPTALSKLKGLAFVIITWVSISILLYLKIPSAFTKIYAEDGALSLQQALTSHFPHDFFVPYAGYLDVLARTAGRVATSFPLASAAHIFFLYNSLMLTWICWVVFRASEGHIASRFVRGFLALSLILIPIGNFESIANTTNLHFFFMSACLPIFLVRNPTKFDTYVFSFFVLVSALSTPLMVFYLPLIAYLRMTDSKTNRLRNFKLFDYAWLVGMACQALFIAIRALGERTANGISTVTKTGFLYLDRVFGSSFFPWWGGVSDSTPSILPQYFSAKIYLLLRGLFALVFLVVLIILMYKWFKRNPSLKRTAITVFSTGIIYWFIVGILFNPEPRYAIFPSFGLILILLYTQSEKVASSPTLRSSLIFVLIVLTWIGSWSPSTLRTQGPVWSVEYQKAVKKCAENASTVNIPIIPINKDWHVTIDCSRTK